MSKTILVVDDEENICQLLRELLENEGYKVTTALSGKEGLARLKKEKFDLVLLDFFMPEMSGREVAEEIRRDAKLKGLKIIMVTVAQYGKEGYAELKKLNILDYIQKPFDNQDIINRINKAIK